MSATFRSMVATGLEEARRRTGAVSVHSAELDGDVLAEEIKRAIEAAGYRIHNAEFCVRIPPQARGLGRPMTPEERVRFGLEKEVHGERST